MKRRQQRTLVILLTMGMFIGVLALGAVGFRTQTVRAEVEEAMYTLIEKKDGYELRAYAPQILARVKVEGRAEGAMNRGFGPLAGYIFGGNRKRLPDGALAEESQKIAMTTPVTMETTAAEGDGEHWVAFTMPSEFSLDTLPAPRDEAVLLEAREAYTAAAIRFTGGGGMSAMREHEALLRACLERDGVEVTGQPVYARYDPPWTLPVLRRNEVILPVKAEAAPQASVEVEDVQPEQEQ